MQVNPDDTACAGMRSLALERLGRTSDALQESERAVVRAPDSADAHSMRGWALLQKGRYKESQEAFREALRLEPTHEFARTGMIQALNSNNILFRMMFKFHSMASRLGSGSRWMLIIGLFVGMRLLRSFADANPAWKPYVLPITILYFAFCMLSWIADPLFNAFLRFHPFGKYLLSHQREMGFEHRCRSVGGFAHQCFGSVSSKRFCGCDLDGHRFLCICPFPLPSHSTSIVDGLAGLQSLWQD